MITETKEAYTFVCKQNGFVNQMFVDFAKMILTRVLTR